MLLTVRHVNGVESTARHMSAEPYSLALETARAMAVAIAEARQRPLEPTGAVEAPLERQAHDVHQYEDHAAPGCSNLASTDPLEPANFEEEQVYAAGAAAPGRRGAAATQAGAVLRKRQVACRSVVATGEWQVLRK